MMFKRAIIPAAMLMALTTGCGQDLTEDSAVFAEANVEDPIGNQADKVLGTWVGKVANEDTTCELKFSTYDAGYSGDTTGRKTRTLTSHLYVVGESPTPSVFGLATEQFLAQKNNPRIVLDYSDSAEGFGAALRKYAKITISMKNGEPVEARGQRGTIRLSVFNEAEFDFRCVGLVKQD